MTTENTGRYVQLFTSSLRISQQNNHNVGKTKCIELASSTLDTLPWVPLNNYITSTSMVAKECDI